MKKIKMLQTENIMTSVGAKSFFKDGVYAVEDWIADSFMGRGLALHIKEIKEQDTNYEDMGVVELRKAAQEAGIKGYNSMRKEQLIDALSPLQPPKEPFEKLNLTGGQRPPEFKRG